NTNKNWLKHLLLENNQRQKYIRNNRSVFVREDPKFLRILPQHSDIITAIQEKNPVYMLLKVPNVDSNLHKKSLIPLIPGYKVFIYYGSCYCTIELGWCEVKQIILWILNEFGADSKFQNRLNIQQTFEKSDDLHQYLENSSTLNYNSRLSLPFLLGLTTTENVKWLRGYVGAHYSNIFELEYKQYKAEKEINTIIKSAKRDANSLEAEIKQGIQTELTFNLQKSDIDSTLIQAMSNKIIKMQKELNNTKKRLCRSHQTVIALQELLEKESNNSSEDDECSDIESDQDLSETLNLQEILNLLIIKGKLGSTVFVSTEIFLELILRQPCPKCCNTDIVTKKHQIKVSGFLVKINITCNKCSTTVFYKNETDGVDYSKLVAGAGLVGGVNREEWMTMLCACGITRQSGKKQYFQKQEAFFQKIQESAESSANFALHAACEQVKLQGNHVLEVSFDNSWSHVRKASQASGEFIYHGKIDGYRAKPIVGYHLVEKPRIYKNKKEETIVINEGNYNNSSRQMEHANLIGSITKITPTLIEYDIVLGVAIDGDLNSNKTLANQPIVSKIFADLKHKAATVRKKIDEKWKYLEQPIMNFYNRAVYAACIRTGNNNHLSPTDNDLHQLHYDVQREDKRICNVAEIHNRNEIRAKKITQQKNQLQDFDWSQDLVPYGKSVQDNIIKYTFRPSFSDIIPNFDSFILCEGCGSFPKRFPEQGLCKLCGFYWNHELSHFIINPKFHSAKGKSLTQPKLNMIEIVLLEVFNLQHFKELQYKSIESFILKKDTLTIMPTGGGKTLIFSIASTLFYGLTVVFTPLKSVMECQLRELISIGIPSAYLFAATDQPLDMQEKIFSEIASGFIKILWITPEKFIQNFQFRQMLKKVAEIRGIQFVVDEAHCIKEYANFRPAWNQLSQLKEEFGSAPILLLTATCSEYMASQLSINLKCFSLNIIRNIQIYRPELKLQVLPKPVKKDKLLDAIFKIINETTTGRIIIYCATPDECSNIMIALKKQYNPDLITIYHGKMSNADRKITLTGWKTGLYRYIVATNAFGMGIHVADVRVIIHVTFPISITNLVQEIGRAARDGNSEEDPITTIFESSYCCEDTYTCRQILYYTPFKWTTDPQIPECNICDNCIRKIQDKATKANIRNDLLKILDITEKLLKMVEEKKLTSFGREELVDVFLKADNKNTKSKNLSLLWTGEVAIYKPMISTRDACFHMVDKLIIKGFIKQNIIIEPIRPNSLILSYSCSIIAISDNAREQITINEWWEFVKQSSRQKK
ncbi:19513_t:CDS:2, partial [Dentiscutata erythropus]